MNERSKKNEPISSADRFAKTSSIPLTEEDLTGVSGGDAPPTEQISLSFGKIEYKYSFR
jgi:hypothetical protein